MAQMPLNSTSYSASDVTFSDLPIVETPARRVEHRSKTLRQKNETVAADLEKSLQLLDEAVGGPGDFVKPLVFERKHYPVKAEFTNPEVLDASSLGDGSFAVKPYFERTMMLETTNVGLVLEENPTLADCSGLHGDFVTALNSTSDPLELSAELARLTREQSLLLGKLAPVSSRPSSDLLQRVESTKRTLQQEYSTWLLLTSLYAERLRVSNELELKAPVTAVGCDDKNCVESLYEQESSLREAQTVIDWLEQLGAERLSESCSREEFFTEQGQIGENTLHLLKSNKRNKTSIITSMDPDAGLWQKASAHDLDVEDEARLLEHLFCLLRAGRMSDAQDLCVRSGQAWRAASLNGWKLSHDPNVDVEPSSGVLPLEGNQSRKLWLKMASHMATKGDLCIWERGIYGACCGHKEALLSVCSGWEDNLWALLRHHVMKRVESELNVLSDDVPTQESDDTAGALNLPLVFEELEGLSESMRRSSATVFPSIQKLVILGDIKGLLQHVRELSDSVSVATAAARGHVLRFLSAIVLWLRLLGLREVGSDETMCESVVLEQYIQWLGSNCMNELVASVASHLPGDRHISCLSEQLKDVEDADSRRAAIQQAQESGLDVAALARAVTSLTIRSNQLSSSSQSQMAEKKLTECIEWLLFVPHLELDVLCFSNKILRHLLVHGKSEACRELMTRLPSDLLQRVSAAHQGCSSAQPSLHLRVQNAIREHISLSAYINATDAFTSWFSSFESSSVATSVKEKLANSASEQLYNVLLFPDGGWLIDLVEDTENEENRQREMTALRQLYIPRVAILLAKIAKSTGKHTDIQRIADLISSEQHKLYKVFSKSDLRQLLTQLASDCADAWKSNIDPFLPRKQ